MKNYSYEEIQDFIRSEISKAYNKNLVFCHSRSQQGNLLSFIVVDEDISFTTPWRDGTQTLKKGDYLHACTDDVYGLATEMFNKLYEKVAFKTTISP